MSWREDRCTATAPDGVRCQVLVHDDGQHAAMTGFDLSPARGARKGSAATYSTWGEPWTGTRPGQGTLAWAPTMPMVEALADH
jgi:hypothetical protein